MNLEEKVWQNDCYMRRNSAEIEIMGKFLFGNELRKIIQKARREGFSLHSLSAKNDLFVLRFVRGRK